VELAMQEVTREVTQGKKRKTPQARSFQDTETAAQALGAGARNRKTDKVACGVALLALLVVSALGLLPVHAQSVIPTRRPVKHLVTPVYPELAKKLNLTGTARIEVTISPDGTVKRTRILGGHPVLASEAEHAAEKSTFEPAPTETVEVIEFKF
jgi:TonB family protein